MEHCLRPRFEAKPTVVCTECGTELTNLDIALHKKMVNRGATSFLCIDCLGEKFDMTRHELYDKAEQFKRQGCTLFK